MGRGRSRPGVRRRPENPELRCIGRPPSIAKRAWTRGALGLITALLVSACAASGALAAGHGGSGGVGPSGGGCGDFRFGSRTLSRGDCGSDVRTLNWLLRARASASVDLGPDYDGATVAAVRALERAAGLSPDGVFAAPARRSLVAGLATDLASWYGAPLYGHQTACGLVLRRRTLGVANKTLPCGTRVVFGYRGSWVTTTVIDRGPYLGTRKWDLTQATADRLHFTSAGVGSVKVAVLP